MRKTETRKLGETTYIVKQLGARQGAKVFTRLMKLLAAAKEGLAGGEEATLAKLQALVDNVKEDDVDALCTAFAPETELQIPDARDPRGYRQPRLEDVFEDHFAGNYGELFQWLAFCLEVNFGGFFAGLGLKKRSVPDGSAGAATNGSTSLPASIGTSGA